MYSFKWLSNTPLCICTTAFLSIHLHVGECAGLLCMTLCNPVDYSPPGSSATGLRGTSSSTTSGRSSPCGVSRPPGICLSSAILAGRRHSPKHKRGLTCWDQGPSLGLLGLWVARRDSLLRGCKTRAQEEPQTRLEAEIQAAGGVPRAIALYMHKSFPARHRESTRRDPEQ